MGDKSGQPKKWPLFEAIRTREKNLEQILENDASTINFFDRFSGLTPLMLAATLGNVSAVRILLKFSANPLETDSLGRTAVSIAVQRHQCEILEILLPACENHHLLLPAERLFPLADGTLPLMIAFGAGDLDVSRRLLDFGGYLSLVWVRRKDKHTALHAACASGNLDCVILALSLLQENPTEQIRLLSLRNASGDTPFNFACESGNGELVEHLLTSLPPFVVQLEKGKRHWNSISSSAVSGNAKAIALLVNSGLNYKTVTHRGHLGPLHLACLSGDLTSVQLCMRMKIHVNAKDFSGYTPLYYACMSGSLSLVSFLLQYEDVDGGAKFPRTGQSCLHAAAMGNSPHIINLFMRRYRLNPEVGDRCGFTPLMAAAQVGAEDGVECLLASMSPESVFAMTYAAAPGKLSYPEFPGEGVRALAFAAFGGFARICHMILQAAAKSSIPITELLNSTTKTNYGFGRGHGENYGRSSAGVTPLWLACSNGHYLASELLVKWGADVSLSASERLKHTPLHEALYSRNLRLVELLVQSGASFQEKTSFVKKKVTDPQTGKVYIEVGRTAASITRDMYGDSQFQRLEIIERRLKAQQSSNKEEELKNEKVYKTPEVVASPLGRSHAACCSSLAFFFMHNIIHRDCSPLSVNQLTKSLRRAHLWPQPKHLPTEAEFNVLRDHVTEVEQEVRKQIAAQADGVNVDILGLGSMTPLKKEWLLSSNIHPAIGEIILPLLPNDPFRISHFFRIVGVASLTHIDKSVSFVDILCASCTVVCLKQVTNSSVREVVMGIVDWCNEFCEEKKRNPQSMQTADSNSQYLQSGLNPTAPDADADADAEEVNAYEEPNIDNLARVGILNLADSEMDMWDDVKSEASDISYLSLSSANDMSVSENMDGEDPGLQLNPDYLSLEQIGISYDDTSSVYSEESVTNESSMLLKKNKPDTKKEERIAAEF